MTVNTERIGSSSICSGNRPSWLWKYSRDLKAQSLQKAESFLNSPPPGSGLPEQALDSCHAALR